jgi:hypothetical protein
MLDEPAWLRATYLRDMLDHLFRGQGPHLTKGGRRRSRLFGCACCRVIWEKIPDGACRLAVETAEQYAAGEATKEDMKGSLRPAAAFLGSGGMAVQAVFRVASPEAKRAAWASVEASSAYHGGWARNDGVFCDLLRDVFANPFRPVTLAAAHRTPAVVSLARAAYDERHLPGGELDPERLAVLADALEEAGAPAELVAHLRSAGPHVRGCHAIDLILGLG